MSDTQGILARITALRQRLEQAQGILREAAADLPASDLAEKLEQEVLAGTKVQSLLDGSLRQIAGALRGDDGVRPTLLTARARQLLERGRAMVLDLKRLSDDSSLACDDLDDPLAQGVRSAAAMVEAALRFVQAFPDAPSGQLRLCEGLDGLLSVVAERIGALTHAAAQRRGDNERIDTLAHWLTLIQQGRPVALEPFVDLVDSVETEARDGAPLRFLTAGSSAGANWLPRHVAAHSLTVAQVVARLVRHAPDLLMTPDAPVLAALVHDIGLFAVPADVLGQPGPLSDPQKRIIERHPRHGADLIARQMPNVVGLAEAIAGHHERLDGSGYPAGLVGAQIAPGARLLAIADVYAALACPRPHRSAADPRTALTDTLMAAEHGALDRRFAEPLLHLAFYPVGTVVELTDGSVARVIATHAPRADVHAPARPVVQVLADGHGQILAHPATLDLAQCEGRAVVRALPVAQRRRILTARYPEWAA